MRSSLRIMSVLFLASCTAPQVVVDDKDQEEADIQAIKRTIELWEEVYTSGDSFHGQKCGGYTCRSSESRLHPFYQPAFDKSLGISRRLAVNQMPLGSWVAARGSIPPAPTIKSVSKLLELFGKRVVS